MKNFSVLFFLFSIVLSSCEHDAANIDINNVEAHRAYQDSILKLSNDPDLKLIALKGLISEYRNLKLDNKDNNPNYLYLIARLYSALFSNKDFQFNGFVFDTVSNKLRDPDLYINYVDSSLYYNEEALKKNPNDIKAMYNFCNVWYSELFYYSTKKSQNITIPYSFLRDKIKWNSRLNFILNNSNKFYNIDNSPNKESSQFIVTVPYELLLIELNADTFNYSLDDNLNKIIKWHELYSTLKKIKNFNFTYQQDLLNSNFLIIYNKAIKIYNEKHEWDNVTSNEYHNCEQMNLWLYSNGKYKQETYELDISSIPYHDRMNLTAVDIACCTAPGGKRFVSHRSEGTYKTEGSIIYFFPQSGSGIAIAGLDPEKNIRYMKINSYGNLEYLRENDYETVELNKR